MKAIYLLIFSLVFLNIACNDKDDNDVGDPIGNCAAQEGSMHVKFMGEEYNITSFSNSFAYVNIGDKPGRAIQIIANIPDGHFSLTASGLEEHNSTPDALKEKIYTVLDSDHTECITINTTSYCDGALISYSKSNIQYVTTFDSHETSITITHMDAQTKSVSGKFEGILFNSQNPFSSDSMYIEGTFDNLCYTVVN